MGQKNNMKKNSGTHHPGKTWTWLQVSVISVFGGRDKWTPGTV